MKCANKIIISVVGIWAWIGMSLLCAGQLAGKVIVLDPGHGAKNSSSVIVNDGCRSKSGAYERDVVIDIAGAVADDFLAAGATVYFTRDKEHFWRAAESQDKDNISRAEFANSKNADLFLRIHCNWSPNKKQRGVLVLWYKDDSKKLAETVFAEIKKSGVRIEGIRKQHLVGFQYAEVPAILIEFGYLSNKEDEKLLKDPKYIQKLSAATVSGLEKFYSASPR
jgi:N-acetylmuramoyl-L-alanine amidase